MTKPALGNLRQGPNPNWQPGRGHEMAIHKMAEWIILNLGLGEVEARKAAFALWRVSQKAHYR